MKKPTQLQPLRLRYSRLVPCRGHRIGRVGADSHGSESSGRPNSASRFSLGPADGPRSPVSLALDGVLMIDFGFAALLALITLGVGKRLLDWLGQTPDHPLDAVALALPLGMGAAALAVLALGELGCLNLLGVTIVLAVFTELGILSSVRLLRALGARHHGLRRGRPFDRAGIWVALCTGLALLATSAAAIAPVTDGDALCYHLQVPKAFLMRGSVEFLPDLHETVYPLVTELLYAIALEIPRASGMPRNPVVSGPGARRQRDRTRPADAWQPRLVGRSRDTSRARDLERNDGTAQ